MVDSASPQAIAPMETELYTTHRRSYDDPQPDWIRLADAPFVLPRQSKEGWSETMYSQFLAGGSIDKLPIPSGMAFNPGHPSVRSKGGEDLIFVGIDWDGRRFKWTWGDLTKSPLKRHGFSRHPWEMEYAGLALEIVDAGTWENLKGHAAFTWEMMLDVIARMIEQKQLRIWARPGSPTAPFSLISSDSWVHFEVNDWPKGQAASDNGERLFSTHLELTSPT
jgi:hypothetical protein